MSEIKDEEQIPYKFYSRLDDPASISILDNLGLSQAYLSFVKHRESKEILAQLARNIKLIISDYYENPEKRCRDINYWMNEKIRTCEAKIVGEISSESTGVFNYVKWNKIGKDPIVCKRKQDPYKTNNVEIMKKLDDYCEIRDNIRWDIFKNYDECLRYNRYIKQKKKVFTSVVQGICRDNECTLKDYKIGDNCTLERMDDTFREINCNALYEKAQIQEALPVIKERSPLEIGFFIIVSFILFYLFILFLEKFTPVGSIISRFRRRKYYLKRNFDSVDDDRYSLYHSEGMPADSENKRYYIEYAKPHN
ncbi:PIR protein [Plasmodium vivax]|uniref:VIR protein n=1 Tax=Plasmodium vivax TaxID=5855 RepID=A0A565A3L3_PLAVI|nr:PIR protein [Plasmodium vivax]VUZ99372.1 PIR protein [Plasmodium vivax]